MSYIDNNLLSGEKVTYRTSLHWIVFAPPAVNLVIGFALIVSMTHPLGLMSGIFLMLGGIVLFVNALVKYFSAEYGITNKRIIMAQGFVQRQAIETMLSRIEGIDVHQGILGRVLDYGTVQTTVTGAPRRSFATMRAPMKFRRKVQQQIIEEG